MAQDELDPFEPLQPKQSVGLRDAKPSEAPTWFEALKLGIPVQPELTVFEKLKADLQPTNAEGLQGAASNAGRSFAEIPIGMVLDTSAILGKTIGEAITGQPADEPIGKLAQYARDAVAKVTPVPETVQRNPSFLNTTLPSAIGSTVGFAATGGAGGTTGIALTGALSQGAQAYQEAKDRNADDSTALMAWALSLPVGATEAIPLGHLAERINTASGGGFVRILREMAVQAGEETAQEVGQTALSNLIAQHTGAPERKIIDGLASSAGAAAIVGALFGGVGGALGHANSSTALGPENAGAPQAGAPEPRSGPARIAETAEQPYQGQGDAEMSQAASAPVDPMMRAVMAADSGERSVIGARPTLLEALKAHVAEMQAEQAAAQPELSVQPEASPRLDQQTDEAARTAKIATERPDLPPHMHQILAKADIYDEQNAGKTTPFNPAKPMFTDVTPEGYGPGPGSESPSLTLEQGRMLNSINEAKTLLRAKKMSPEERASVERSVKNTEIRYREAGGPPITPHPDVIDAGYQPRVPADQVRDVPEMVPAEMPKGAQLGTDLTGEPVFSKQERGDLGRPDEGLKKPKATQIGAFDEVGGLFEKQAEQRDAGSFPLPERLAEPDTQSKLFVMARLAGHAQAGGEAVMSEDGEFVRRTEWIPSTDWWMERPVDMGQRDVRQLVKKARDPAAEFTPREQKMLRWMVSVADENLHGPSMGHGDRISQIQAELDDLYGQLGRKAKTTTRSTGLDPETLALATKIAKLHIEKGYREFKQFAEEIVAKFGEHIRPYLREAWGAAGGVEEPPTAAAEPPSIPPEGPHFDEKPGDANKPPEKLIDRWLGERQVSHTAAEIEATRKENELKTLAPKRAEFRKFDQAMFVYIDAKNDPGMAEKFGAKWTPEQRTTYYRSQNLPPEVQALADRIIAENKDQGSRLSDAGLIKNQVENYVPRIYEPKEEALGGTQPESKAKFTLSSGRLKGRTFSSIGEAWAAGYELRVKGAIEAQKIARQQTDQVLFDKALIREGMKAGVFSTSPEEGFAPVEHPNFKPYDVIARAAAGTKYSELETFGAGTFADENGNIFQRRQIYAPEALAQQLNNILGRSKLNDIRGVQALTRITSAVKQSILFTSLFHHQSVLRSYVFGAPLKDINPLTAYRKGKASVEEFGPTLRKLVDRGLTLGYQQEFDDLKQSRATKFEEMVARIPGIKQALPRIGKFREWNENFLFKRLIPVLKAQASLLAYREELTRNREALAKGTITEDQIAESVASYANNNFGGLNLQRMNRNPTAQHALRLALLAPDWTESNLRAAVLAAKPGQEGALYRRLWANTLLRGGIATVAFNLLMASFDKDKDDPASKDFWSRYQEAWKEGNLRWLDVDVTPLLGRDEDMQRKYFSVLGHFKDPLRMISNPVRFFRAKGSVTTKLALEALTGKDPLDRPYTSLAELLGTDEKGDYKVGDRKGTPKGGKLAGETVSFKSSEDGPLKWEQLPSFMLAQAKGATPIQAQAAMDLLTGQIDWFDATTHALGLMTSTSPPRSPDKLIERDQKQAADSGDKEAEELARSFMNQQGDQPGARKLAQMRDAADTPEAKAQVQAQLQALLKRYTAAKRPDTKKP